MPVKQTAGSLTPVKRCKCSAGHKKHLKNVTHVIFDLDGTLLGNFHQLI